jgi:threonine/homoserine/homoserine lactone efflux protein
MNVEIGIGGLILVAAITPGPNNLLVLQLATERGIKYALPAITGVVAGGLVMFALAQIGLGAVVARHAWLQIGTVTCGAIYLAALGLLLVYRSFSAVSIAASSAPGAPKGGLPLFAFQFVNPKTWVLVLTVSAAAHCIGPCNAQSNEITLLLLLIAIPSGCLLAWAALGRVAARILQGGLARARFERVMGVLLIASAVSLLGTWRSSLADIPLHRPHTSAQGIQRREATKVPGRALSRPYPSPPTGDI